MSGTSPPQEKRIGGFVKSLGIVAAIVVVLGCGPILRLRPHGATIQEQCGVGSEEVTREQALCIARLGGLDIGIRPWRVRDERDIRSLEGVWEICNTTELGHGSVGPKGTCWEISKATGDIVAVRRWVGVTVE